MTSIKEAGLSDVEMIRQIAEQTWWPAYQVILPAEQIRYMLQEIYDPQKIIQQLETGSQEYLLLLEDNRPVAFVSYAVEEGSADTFKIHKLYCLPATQGKGYGKMLVEEVAEITKKAGKKFLILNVNRQNNAKLFYERLGFEVQYEIDIPIGSYQMNDYVMRSIIT
ncbi:MAG: GNAT family N-acetyltransferase [Sphingobacteriaceae bacterium]